MPDLYGLSSRVLAGSPPLGLQGLSARVLASSTEILPPGLYALIGDEWRRLDSD